MLTQEYGNNKRKDGGNLTGGLPRVIQEYLLPLSVDRETELLQSAYWRETGVCD